VGYLLNVARNQHAQHKLNTYKISTTFSLLVLLVVVIMP
jgi:hypothetical protein